MIYLVINFEKMKIVKVYDDLQKNRVLGVGGGV